MLVLTRKTLEQIHIGDNITISILKLKGNAVRIGIEAPREIRVLRGELQTVDGALEVSATESASTTSESESSDEEPTISEQQWEAMKKIDGRRKACRPARRCAPPRRAFAPLASIMRGTNLAASSAAVSE